MLDTSSMTARCALKTAAAAVLALALHASTPSAFAADVLWDNSTGNFLWDAADATNWSTDTLPTSLDTAIFGADGVGDISLSGSIQTIQAIQFTNTAGAYSISNGTLSLSSIALSGNSSSIAAPVNGTALALAVNSAS